MQELMSRHKAYALNPRDCLKTTLFQKWQKMVAPPGKKIFSEYFRTRTEELLAWIETGLSRRDRTKKD